MTCRGSGRPGGVLRSCISTLPPASSPGVARSRGRPLAWTSSMTWDRCSRGWVRRAWSKVSGQARCAASRSSAEARVSRCGMPTSIGVVTTFAAAGSTRTDRSSVPRRPAGW